MDDEDDRHLWPLSATMVRAFFLGPMIWKERERQCISVDGYFDKGQVSAGVHCRAPLWLHLLSGFRQTSSSQAGRRETMRRFDS